MSQALADASATLRWLYMFGNGADMVVLIAVVLLLLLHMAKNLWSFWQCCCPADNDGSRAQCPAIAPTGRWLISLCDTTSWRRRFESMPRICYVCEIFNEIYLSAVELDSTIKSALIGPFCHVFSCLLRCCNIQMCTWDNLSVRDICV